MGDEPTEIFRIRKNCRYRIQTCFLKELTGREFTRRFLNRHPTNPGVWPKSTDRIIEMVRMNAVIRKLRKIGPPRLRRSGPHFPNQR